MSPPTAVAMNSSRKSGLGQGQQWQRAIELLEEVRRSGSKPDVVTYSAAVSACEKCRRWDNALALLRSMRGGVGLIPNIVTYSAAMAACEKGYQWAHALELLGAMRKARRVAGGSWPWCSSSACSFCA